MKLTPGIEVTVKLDGKEHRFTLVATGGAGNWQLYVKAPLAVLFGAMTVGDVVGAWTPPVKGAVAMKVELTAIM